MRTHALRRFCGGRQVACCGGPARALGSPWGRRSRRIPCPCRIREAAAPQPVERRRATVAAHRLRRQAPRRRYPLEPGGRRAAGRSTTDRAQDACPFQGAEAMGATRRVRGVLVAPRGALGRADCHHLGSPHLEAAVCVHRDDLALAPADVRPAIEDHAGGGKCPFTSGHSS